MSFAFSSTSAATPFAFGVAPWTFPSLTTEAPAAASAEAATAAASSSASPPSSTAAFGTFAGMAFPAGPVQPSPFGVWPPFPSASSFGFPPGSLSSPFPSGQTHLTPTAHLLTLKRNVEFGLQLSPHLKTREGVFALSWHEVSASSPRATLLLRYCAVGGRRWRELLTDSGHDAAHGWIVEKLAAELAEGHGYDHEVRGENDRGALDLLLVNRPQLVLSMAPVLLAAPSVAVRLRERRDRRETTRLVEAIVLDLASFPDRLEPALALIALILERGGSFEQALQAIIAQSHVQALLHIIKAATVEQLQSVSSATLHLARRLEQEQRYLSLRRLCRELIERLCEWQAAEALVVSLSSPSSAPSASEPGVASSSTWSSSSSSSSSSLVAWLSAFEAALPDRMLVQLCRTRGSDTAWLAALPQFDWLELAEGGVMWKLQSTEALLGATVERVQQLAARERARAADDEVRPASGPLSPPALIAHLIIEALASMRDTDRHDPTSAPLRALLSAATAPEFASSSPSSPSGGLCIPGAFHIITAFAEDKMISVALLFHEAGIVADDNGSFTLHLLRRRHWTALRRWMTPQNAQFAMPLGWLGERDPFFSSVDPAGSSGSSAIPAQPHPHLAAGSRCDVWDAACRPSQLLENAPIQQLVRHAIDWHYATVTPQLRSALSAHLLPELHAEVLSFLMPPSTLRAPAPPVAETDPSLRALDSAVAALLPSHSDIVAELRRVHHQLRESAVERGFLERAFEAERQMLMLRP